MKLQYWNAPCEIKSATVEGKEGIVKAYVSIFDTKDSGGDIVRRGAFTRSIQAKKGKFPVLSNHDWTKQIGWGLMATEDNVGLYTESWYDIENNAKAREHFSLIQKALEIDAQAGFSFGYRPEKWKIDSAADTRDLTEVKLYEWSPVTFPMHEGTFAVDAKSLDAVDTLDAGVSLLLETFREKGYSEKEILSALGSRLADSSSDPSLNAHSLLQSLHSLENRIRATA